MTRYSKKIGGDKGNYNWSATYDISPDGYLGISQPQDCGGVDRILLCPKQVEQLVSFVKPRGQKTTTKRA